MYTFGPGSQARLQELHPDLQLILTKAICVLDFTITEGHRNSMRQNALFAQGRTRVRYPNSKHNAIPSKAADCAPYPINYDHREEFAYMAGIMKGIATELLANGEITHTLRWGGDWDLDGDLDDNGFDDLPHVELI